LAPKNRSQNFSSGNLNSRILGVSGWAAMPPLHWLFLSLRSQWYNQVSSRVTNRDRKLFGSRGLDTLLYTLLVVQSGLWYAIRQCWEKVKVNAALTGFLRHRDLCSLLYPRHWNFLPLALDALCISQTHSELR
jgi:hypothetical protein